MEVFRFDEELGIPIAQHGSNFRIAPLATGGRVQVSVLYVPAGGCIGRHPAVGRQFFGLIGGSGRVAGGEGTERELHAGYGLIFEDGEMHEAASDQGMTALCIEGEIEMLATQVTKEIVVADYDPAWASWFEQLRTLVAEAVGDAALRIEHVGSTSVPGMAAKPIIDLDVVVASEADVGPAIERLAAIGYRWRGDLGVPGRQAFTQLRASGLPDHHLYLVVRNNKAHLDHVLLRDLLRADGDARRRYGELKRQIAALAERDMDYYVAAKAELVAELLTRARAERGLPPETYWVPTPAP